MRKRKQQENLQNGLRSIKANNDTTNSYEKTRLPPRWLYCPPMGKIIAKKFLPMKTPLDESYDHLIDEPKYRFHPQSVFAMPLVGAKPGSRIGLWIDLTNSDNFYRGDTVRKNGCKFVKMKMVGHGETPTPEQTRAFIDLVDEFLQQNPTDIVVVHCTHGFNRTGFLISAYLYEKAGLSIEMAVKEFADCRPKGIYKELYLNDLRQRFGDEDDELMAPGRPLWESGPVTDEEFTNGGIFNIELNGEIDSSSKTDLMQPTTSSSAAISAISRNIPVFMDGKILSVLFVEDVELRKSIQEKARKFCGYASKGFPGSQPVSLERLEGSFLESEPYMVSWKADGIRYLVLIDGKDRVFAFDRDNNPFKITKMAFIRRSDIEPQREGNIHEEEFISGTLVDAEMVIDKFETGGKIQEIPRLLIYDIIALHGNDMRNDSFTRRFDLIETELIRPRTDAFKFGRLKRENEPIGVRRKGFWDIKSTHKLFERGFLSCHEVDGLIFQPVNRPYTAGRFDHLLKWKPPELSTIDFRLEIKKVLVHGMLPEWVGELHVLHLDRPFALIKPTKQLQKYNKKIIECRFARDTKTWEFLRERTDKSHPNALSTAQSVWGTIIHPIAKNDLLSFISSRAFDATRKNTS